MSEKCFDAAEESGFSTPKKELNDDKEVLLEKAVMKRLLEVSLPPLVAIVLALKNGDTRSSDKGNHYDGCKNVYQC